ncbi:EamA family transporter RarD [Marinicella litoralis]|uniref:Chloramphenicol-sensitive protein RarD n=1 Tax=Marinicella litoralis TaxID=644220 RepID=A0A4R6XTZ0_9GAMM|nr:EamA family transporter RarD [Marinicella litoralis]TDR23256.1 chloramphenicol-sensitive protein RarD [Marinicella litoralis]
MPISEHNKGLQAGLFCFIFWGFAPIYFKLLKHVPAIEIIAHRIIWAALFLLLFLAIRERQQLIHSLKVTKKQLLILFISGSLVISNWLLFVWAVNDGQILATSLGYFINPLVNVFLGMLFLQERLNKVQIIALTLAASTTIYLGIFIGQPPWIALALAITFGLYGLVRKTLDVRPLIGLFWETALLMIPALVFLTMLSSNQTSSNLDMSTMWLLVFSGLITILPLIGFNYAAKRLTLTVIGFLQYIAPTISFLIAVYFFGEVFTFGHKVAFTGIWLALFILSWQPMMRLIKRKPVK